MAARVIEMLEGRASLAERVTLFAALPTTTTRQLESLARGVEALRQPADEDGDAYPTTGVRRVRVGSRDLYKLDLVPGEAVNGTASAIAEHAAAQAPRTLLFIVGAHGFRVDKGAASSGGPSPEEVIVSAHAFLIGGDVH